MRDYHINIFYSEDDEGYIADIPDLDACTAFGQTPDEALQELQKAKELWLQAARAEKKPIPPPQYRPVIYQDAVAEKLEKPERNRLAIECAKLSPVMEKALAEEGME
jgi:predicted RNase H-like HicB family nuclease